VIQVFHGPNIFEKNALCSFVQMEFLGRWDDITQNTDSASCIGRWKKRPFEELAPVAERISRNSVSSMSDGGVKFYVVLWWVV
jgi:hypothetical protein